MNQQDDVDRLAEQVGAELIGRYGSEIGFCVMIVGQPFVVNGEVVDQPFAMTSNTALPGVLMTLSRALDNAAAVAKRESDAAQAKSPILTEMN